MLNLKQKIKDHKGVEVSQTYGEVLGELMFLISNEDQPQNKYRYYTLGLSFLEKDEVELDKETVEFVMAKVMRVGTPLTVGRIKEFLESE